MTEEEIEISETGINELEKRITEAFEIFDHSGNKSVDVREVGTILRSLGCCPTEAEIQEVIACIEDPETTGSVNLSKFVPYVSQIFTEHKYQPAEPEKLLEAFQTLDTANKGFLTKEYLSKLLLEEGEPFSQEELNEMMSIACDPQTDSIPYEYYINQIMYKPPPEKDNYYLADEIEAAKPPPPKAITMSFLEEQE